MSDLLHSLVQRNVDGVAPVVRPRLASRFEAAPDHSPEQLGAGEDSVEAAEYPSRPFGIDSVQHESVPAWPGFQGEPRWDREFGDRLNAVTSQLVDLRGVVESYQEPRMPVIREESPNRRDTDSSHPPVTISHVTSETIRERIVESHVENPIVRLTQLLSSDSAEMAPNPPVALPQPVANTPAADRRDASNTHRDSGGLRPSTPPRIESDAPSQSHEANVERHGAVMPQIIIDRQHVASETPLVAVMQPRSKQAAPLPAIQPTRTPPTGERNRPHPDPSVKRSRADASPVSLMPTRTQSTVDHKGSEPLRTAPRIQVEVPSSLSRKSQTVQVTIGRIEVRAPAQQTPAPSKKPRPAAASVMTLDQYLRRRAGGDQ